jgi:hypothetical protein
VIDDGIAEQWPPEVLEALARFKLGDLIAEPPVQFARNPDYPLWVPIGEELAPGGPELVQLGGHQRPEMGIITTQTCDLNEQRRYPAQPFFQVSPCYKLTGEHEALAALIERGFIYRLSAAELGDGIWVADLRLEVALEKSLLVDREPIAAFASEAEEIEFAETLGRRRDRAALGNVVSQILDRQMRKQINNNSNKAKRVFDSVHSLGLAIVEGPRLNPVTVQMHVITRPPAAAADEVEERADELRDWFERWWDKARAIGEKSEPRLRVLANDYHDVRAMDLRVHENLIAFERRP